MQRLLALLSFLLLGILAASPVAAAHTVTVWAGDMDGWAFRTTGTASGAFVAGPATPPLGTGSAQLSVGVDGASGAELRNSGYAGTALADVTALSYWTFVSVAGSGGQAPYIILAVDLDGDLASDDLLFFEPVYQDGTYPGDPVPDQGDVTPGVWQEWDAAVGGWWSLNAGTFGPPLTTLDSYVASNPGATIVNQSSGGGLRLVAGFGAGAWDNFVGSVDAVVIGTTTHETTFDFEVAPLATATPTPTPTPTPTLAPTPAAPTASVGAAAAPTPTPAATGGAETLPDTAVDQRWRSSAAILVVTVLAASIATSSWRHRRTR